MYLAKGGKPPSRWGLYGYFVVMFFVYQDVSASGLSRILVGESGPPPSSERILVFNVAVQKPAFDHSMVRIQEKRKPLSGEYGDIANQESNNQTARFGVIKNLRWTIHNAPVNAYAARRGLAVVLKGDLGLPGLGLVVKTHAVQADIGPQLPLGRVLGHPIGRAHVASLRDERDQLQQRQGGDNSSENQSMPTGRRLFLLFSGVVGGFLCCLAGIEKLHIDRRFNGYVLIGGGLIWAASGLLLWFLTVFRWSWGWLL